MRLWLSQALSSMGDWIGLVAITAIASRVGGDFAGGAVALVIAVRILPSLFLSPVVGVLLDRWNRKTIMVASDIGRGVVLCFLPFVDNLPGLIIASLVLEAFTLMWAPAKEASVPNLVRKEFLPTANSMSLAAAYGTFVPAAVLFAVLAKIPDWLGSSDTFASLNLTEESVALYFDAFTYVLSAAVIATLVIPDARSKAEPSSAAKTDEEKPSSWQEAKEGWIFVRRQPRVRAVIFGMGLGLIGGGAVVPLGAPFVTDVLGAGSSGYSLILAAMGVGVSVGVLIATVLQKRIPQERIFVLSAFGCGGALIAAASMNQLGLAVALIALFGVCAGALYVLGLTLLQTNVSDDMRGRVFVTFYTSTRLCILLALVAAPLLSVGLNELSKALIDGDLDIAGFSFALPGVRLSLWGGGLIILFAGVFAASSFARPIPTDAIVTEHEPDEQ
jgi:dTMP kinase